MDPADSPGGARTVVPLGEGISCCPQPYNGQRRHGTHSGTTSFGPRGMQFQRAPLHRCNDPMQRTIADDRRLTIYEYTNLLGSPNQRLDVDWLRLPVLHRVPNEIRDELLHTERVQENLRRLSAQ